MAGEGTVVARMDRGYSVDVNLVLEVEEVVVFQAGRR